MTRWARVTTSNSKRPLSATSWEDMKKGSAERANQNLPNHKQCQSSRLSLKNDSPQAKRKKNKKKKEYLNEDVNGFMEYLKQSSQVLHNGQLIAADSQEIREEIAVALKKDSRREERRLKRQAAKKNAMKRAESLWVGNRSQEEHGDGMKQKYKRRRGSNNGNVLRNAMDGHTS
ncbi:zinc finger CCHC domain-containing protein 9-like [Mastomys coucha]|uniref:zinc finger CCHC domain-containing protein 9-like n=1 Tax=Mastomys coucha TaxID=35658 RepID=UPI001261D3A0|nr:zinc finger CCHC domain-containing protein 9-like [Mastomys coucha]